MCPAGPGPDERRAAQGSASLNGRGALWALREDWPRGRTAAEPAATGSQSSAIKWRARLERGAHTFPLGVVSSDYWARVL